MDALTLVKHAMVYSAFSPLQRKRILLQLEPTIREKAIETLLDDHLDDWRSLSWSTGMTTLYPAGLIFHWFPSKLKENLKGTIEKEMSATKMFGTLSLHWRTVSRRYAAESIPLACFYSLNPMYVWGVLGIQGQQRWTLSSLYSGFTVSLIHKFVGVIIKTALLDVYKLHAILGKYCNSHLINILLVNGLVDLLTYPIDTIRMRQMLTKEDALEATTNLIRNHGWMSLWNGASYQIRCKVYAVMVLVGIPKLMELIKSYRTGSPSIAA